MEFKTYHDTVIDQIDDEDILAEEQAILDDHEDKVSDFSNRL